MPNIIDIVRKVVKHELEKVRIGELGVVTSVFPHSEEGDNNNHECNVRLKNSTVNGSELELRKVPVVTGIIGAAAIPNVDDLVLVSFVRGNVNQPVITARLYNDEDRPPLHNSNEVIHRLPLAAEDNETVKLELRNIPENSPPREFLLEMPGKIIFQVIDHQILAQVDQCKVTITQEGDSDGVITIESGKSKVTINQDGDIAVESEGQLSLTAKGDMSLEAANINIKSEEAIKIVAGTDGTFKTGAKASIESGAPMEIKSGATAKIEASATMDIKGALVNIN